MQRRYRYVLQLASLFGTHPSQHIEYLLILPVLGNGNSLRERPQVCAPVGTINKSLASYLGW